MGYPFMVHSLPERAPRVVRRPTTRSDGSRPPILDVRVGTPRSSRASDPTTYSVRASARWVQCGDAAQPTRLAKRSAGVRQSRFDAAAGLVSTALLRPALGLQESERGAWRLWACIARTA